MGAHFFRKRLGKKSLKYVGNKYVILEVLSPISSEVTFMGEPLFRANGLNHDKNLHCKTTLGTQTEQQLETNRLAPSTHSTTNDECDKWFEEKALSNDQDTIATTNRTPNRCTQVLSKEEQRRGAHNKRHYRQEIARAVSWDIESERGGNTSTGRAPKSYRQSTIETVFDKTNTNKKVTVYNNSASKKNIDPGEFFANELAFIEIMTREKRRQSSLTEYWSSEVVVNQIDTPISRETTLLQITCWMQERNNRLGYKQIGKAVRMLALLRRCLYPKRDVIRWQSAENGEHLSLEDVSTQ